MIVTIQSPNFLGYGRRMAPRRPMPAYRGYGRYMRYGDDGGDSGAAVSVDDPGNDAGGTVDTNSGGDTSGPAVSIVDSGSSGSYPWANFITTGLQVLPTVLKDGSVIVNTITGGGRPASTPAPSSSSNPWSAVGGGVSYPGQSVAAGVPTWVWVAGGLVVLGGAAFILLT